MVPTSARELLGSDALAHVVTVGPGGEPHLTCAWVGLEGDEIVFGTLFDQRKLNNIRNNPRVVMSIQTDQKNQWGLTEYLVVYGNARITEGGAPELLQQLAYTYLGPDVKFPAMPDPPPGFVTHVSVDRIGGVGPWREED